MTAVRPLAVLALAALLAPAARAQVVLPARPVAKPQEPRSLDLDRASKRAGEPSAGERRASAEGLVLPRPEPAAPASETAAAAPTAAPAVPTPIAGTAAEFVLAELAKVRTIDHPLVARAVESWSAMGDSGRSAALLALADQRAPLVLAGARTLLTTDAPGDVEAVQARLRLHLPNAACVPLVDALCDIDPVRASPAYLGELLAHPQAAVRTAAQRQLALLGGRLPVDALAPALAAKESDARSRAVSLLARVPGERATALLIERATDTSPTVARRAVDALVARDEPGLDRALLGRALGSPWVLRSEAYFLLAIADREDLHVRPILTLSHAEPLLRGMESTDAFVAGACAAALAGIGYRSADVTATAWLEREVPHRLVRVVGAADFSSDFSSLGATAQRRLALLAGESFGSDGPRWIEWWVARASGFVARRAAIPVADGDFGELRVDFTSSVGGPVAFTLLGPAFGAREGAPPAAVEALYLSERQARDLFDLLRREGVFGVDRLPGERGAPYAAGRSLSVALAGRSKRFRFAGERAGEGEAWFDRVADAALSLRARNRWQSFYDPGRHASQRELWLAEHAWWDEARPEPERERRIVDLCLARIAAVAPSQRDGALAEISARTEALALGDFAALVDLLRAERFATARSRTLVDLALHCARLAPGTPAGGLRPPFADKLLETLLEAFGPSAPEELGRVLAAGGRDQIRAAARDSRPFVRAVAAAELVRRSSADELAGDFELVRELLRDESDDVEAAVVLALGGARVEAARVELLVRARLGSPRVQAAALRAIGALGGEGVMDALLAGVSKGGEIAGAAADGLARLGDPGAAPVLISLLGEGGASPAFEPARRGLAAFGASVRPELVRTARSISHPARIEAALLLSEDLAPEAAPILIEVLRADAGNVRAASELAVLTCVDFRGEADAASAWQRWWDYAVKDDAQAWMCGGLERLGVAAPPPDDLRAGSADAFAFLVRVLARPEAHVVERARRELERLTRREVGSVPAAGPEREAWLAELEAALGARDAAR